MDEGVKISKINIWPIMLKLKSIYSLKVLVENLKYLPLLFYRQLKFFLKQTLTRCCIKNVKPNQSSWNLLQWIFGEIPLHLGTRKRFNRLKNTEVTKLLPSARCWREFQYFYIYIYFFQIVWDFALWYNLVFEVYISLNMVTPLILGCQLL